MKKLDYDYCRAAPVLEWMSHKWAVVTLLRIEDKCGGHADWSIRFSDLFRTIPHISEKMLASTLDYLETEGLVTRTAYEEQPPRVEYAVTPLGRNFLREISYVIEWGTLHFDEIQCARHSKG